VAQPLADLPMSPQVKTTRPNMLALDGTHARLMPQLSPFAATNVSNGGSLSSQRSTWRMPMSGNVAQPGGVSVERVGKLLPTL